MSDSQARWDKDIDAYVAPHHRLRVLASIISERGYRSVVDVGCGRATLRGLLGRDVRYVGVDFLPSPSPDIFCVDFNGKNLPSAPSFDAECIVLSGVLEYVKDKERLFRWLMARNKSEHGSFLLTYFNDTHIRRRIARLGGRPVKAHPDWTPLLTYEELRQLLDHLGLTVLDATDLSRGLQRSGGPGAMPHRHRQASTRRIVSPLFAHQWVVLANF